MPVNLFADDLTALGNDERFAAIQDFANSQPNEGWRHDFTEQWDDSSLKAIAAFANTFGGILVVGVKKGSADVACDLRGVESEAEYKTRIASSIAANISPVPSYDVFECHKPDAQKLKFCVVRVRERKALHLITKKNLLPVYIRNVDEARPADASQLRMLIDREKEAATLSVKLTERAEQLRNALVIMSGYQDKDSERWNLSPHQNSPTFLKLEMILGDTVMLELDEFHEEKLSRLVAELYPRICETVERDVATQIDGRHANFYEYTAYHKKLDYETRWRITGAGDIGYATQINYRSEGIQNVWSVVDLACSIILFNRLAMKWWESIGYFGDGYFFAQLSVSSLDVLRHSQHGYYIHAFDPTFTPFPHAKRLDIRKDAISIASSPGNYAIAEGKVTYSPDDSQLPRITTSILNKLLRSLGHTVRTSLLLGSINSLIQT
jgi:hypothetical protein